MNEIPLMNRVALTWLKEHTPKKYSHNYDYRSELTHILLKEVEELRKKVYT